MKFHQPELLLLCLCYLYKPNIMNRVRIKVFADPVCTWCWGSVPVLRALAYRFGEQLEIEYVMGGMIEDVLTFNNRRLAIGGDIALTNRNMHKHWVEASAIHGMPVSDAPNLLFTEERRSTVPQNMAYIAAVLYETKHRNDAMPDAARRFLRLLQESTATERVHTNDVEAIVATAAIVGFKEDKFRSIYESEEVRELYAANKSFCNKYDVHAFPSFLLEYRGEEMMVRGFTTYETLCRCIEQLSYEKVAPLNDGREALNVGNVRQFIEKLGTAYPVEIATAFGLQRINGHSALNVESYSGLPDIMDELVRSEEIAMAPKGNGFIFYSIKEGAPLSQKRGRSFAGVV